MDQKTWTDEQEIRQKRPVEMKPAIARTFIAAYEEMMKRQIHYLPLDKQVTYRWLILINQARRFAESLEDGKDVYQPFLWTG